MASHSSTLAQDRGRTAKRRPSDLGLLYRSQLFGLRRRAEMQHIGRARPAILFEPCNASSYAPRYHWPVILSSRSSRSASSAVSYAFT